MDTALASLALQDDDAEPASSIHRVPREVLLIILSHVKDSLDLCAFLRTSKAMLDLKSDPVLAAAWLLKHRSSGSGGKALRICAVNGRGDVMLSLLQMGVSAVRRTGGRFGFTPLHLSVSYSLPLEVTSFLWRQHQVRKDVESAALVFNTAAKDGQTETLRLMLAHPTPIDVNALSDGWYPLHAAVIYAAERSVEAVGILLAAGASCSLCNRVGKNALHLACSPDVEVAAQARKVKIAQLLLDTPEGKSLVNAPGPDGYAPLHFAAESNLTDACSVLLQAKGCDVNVREARGLTAFDLASRRNNFDVLNLLRQHGCDQS